MHSESKAYNACQKDDGELVKAGWLRAMLVIGKEGGLFQCVTGHAFIISSVNFNHITFSFHLL